MTTPSAPTVPQSASHALTVDAARALALGIVEPIAAAETVPLAAARGRVLASDLLAPFAVPAYDNSAMDGYAFASTQLAGPGECSLAVAGTALAGHPYAGTVEAGRCARIMTGAQLPAGCDTVIPQELVTRDGDTVRFAATAVRAGANVRRAGEDLALDEVALCAGRLLRAADLGLAASLGYAALPVLRRVRVALLSTGDELAEPGTALPPGGRYDSNRPLLAGMLAALPVDVIDLGIVRDDREALDNALRNAARQADVILTSGGVSVGDADFTRELLARLGQVSFVNLAMRPGRPFACGRIRTDEQSHPTLFFGLPGNPVAAATAFLVIVRDALLALSGAAAQPLPRYPARITHAVRKRAGRTEYLRASAARDAHGAWHVTPAGGQGSASLSGLSAANCLIALPAESGDVDAGAMVEMLPFEDAR